MVVNWRAAHCLRIPDGIDQGFRKVVTTDCGKS
jgi:hypothetical protein